MRWLVCFGVLIVALMAFGNVASAAELVAPGESVRLDAIGCDETNGRCIYPCLLGSELPCASCFSSCDEQSQNTANARISLPITLLAAVFSAKTAPFTEFEVEASPNTLNDPLVCAVDYDIAWSGIFASVNGSFGFNTGAEATISLLLRDMTTNKLVKSQLIQYANPNIGVGFKVKGVPLQTPGVRRDQGEVKDQFMTMLRRGHSYRLTLKLEVQSWAFNIPGVPDNPITPVDYMTGDLGAWWNDLRVTLEKDVEDLIANHGHTYLTGRGVGHNNTEAITGIAIFFDDSTDVADDMNDFLEETEGARDLPQVSTLRPSYPNPASPMTTVAFSLPEASHVSIRLFDVNGREVMTLVDGERGGGDHEVVLDASSLPSGIYFYRLTAGQYVETRKLVVAK